MWAPKLWGYWCMDAQMQQHGFICVLGVATQTVDLSTMCSRRTGAGHERRIGCA